MTKEDLAAFIHQHNLAVISTLGREYPESAVVEFADDNLELIFDAYSSSRKFKNIQQSPKVSFVIGWDNNKTVQYEGEARLLTGEELARSKQVYFEKNPDARKWENEPGIVYFRVSPTWVRFTDLNVRPWDVSEFRF